MQKQKGFSAPVLAMSVWTAALAEEIQTGISPRGMIIHGAVQALLLTCISGVFSACWQRAAMQWVWLFSAGAWFLAELFGTVMQAQNICQQELRSMALIGLLPLLLWAGWCIPPSGWDAPARVLCNWPAGRVFRCMRSICSGRFLQVMKSRAACPGCHGSPFWHRRVLLPGCASYLAQRITRNRNCCGHGAQMFSPAWMRCFCSSGSPARSSAPAFSARQCVPCGSARCSAGKER